MRSNLSVCKFCFTASCARSRAWRSNTTNRAAFTLVELLVAVVIITVLLALVLPALSAAREMGRRATCLNNMRQLSLGMTMFADENDGKFPPYIYDVTATPSGPYVSYELSAKMYWSMKDSGLFGNPSILLCPSDKNPVVLTTTGPTGAPATVKTSYGYNFEMFIHNFSLPHLNVAKTALLFDGEPDDAMGKDWFGYTSNPFANSDSGPYAVAANNGNGTGPACAADSSGKTWLCHVPPGNPELSHCEYVGVNASGPQGHSNHGNDYCGPCNGWQCDIKEFNEQLIDRRHFKKANVVFVDGHGEFLKDLPGDSLTSWQ
jgi:prepilin-type N-terminal cleavage/methylation domain-containing protein/prepilin-type processing-associated H-X9-DG protein